MENKKKMGRPTEAVKSHDIRVRVTDSLYNKLLEYSQENSQTMAETAREAFERLTEAKK